MKNFIMLAGALALCAAVPGFWLAGKSQAPMSQGVLTPKVDALVKDWEARNVPAGERVVNLIISDAETATAAGPRPEESARLSAEDSYLLPSADERSFFTRLAIWFRRTFFRRSAVAAGDTPLSRALADKPGAVVWVHRGFETASEEEMSGELERAVLKADKAGAEVNIITEGVGAAPALRAVRKLKNAKRPDGGVVTVNKLIAVDMNRPTLKKLDSVFFSNADRPENLREWISVWSPRGDASRTLIELFSQNHRGKMYDGGELFPMMGRPTEDRLQNIVRFLEVLLKRLYTLEQVIDHLAARAGAQKNTVTVATRDLKGGADKRDILVDDSQRAAQPEDSLSAVGGAWIKEEEEKTGQRQKKALENSRNRVRAIADRSKPEPTGKYPKMSWYQAVEYCKKKGGLPTVEQLQELFAKECTGGNNSDTCSSELWFWSSDVTADTDRAYAMNFGSGDGGDISKDMELYNVRCIL